MDADLTIDVAALDAPHRRALEEVIGRQLSSHERLTISVTDADAQTGASSRLPQTLNDWTNVYEGLSDDEISEIDKVVNSRANLTREVPQLMDESLLDTDILSEILKGMNQQVMATAQQYLAEHQCLAFSAITLYEIIRGMRSKNATRQLTQFLETANNSDVLPIGVPELIRAADLWAAARRAGHPTNDADLIIAATALEGRRVLVTGNTTHFSWIDGLRLSDWRAVTS